MSRRRAVFFAVMVCVILMGIASYLLVARSRSSASGGRRSCSEAIEDFFEVEEAFDEKLFPPPTPVPGWELVEIAFRGDEPWTFTDDGTGVPGGHRTEGAFDAGEDPYSYRADVVRFDPSVPQGEPRRRERRVVVGLKGWVEDAAAPDRLECRAASFSFSTLGAEPFLDRLHNPANPDLEAPNIGPGLTVLAKVVSTEEVDGVTMTTYEQHPVERYEQIRTRFTLDADGQLRWAEAVDTTTGKVLYQRTARPAPDHPPIEDPSGQPIIGMTP